METVLLKFLDMTGDPGNSSRTGLDDGYAVFGLSNPLGGATVLIDSLSTTYILSLFCFLMHDKISTTIIAIRITATALNAIIIII